jgi:HlyD family secretion protein
METRNKILIGLAVAIVFGSAAALSVVRGRDRGIEVRLEGIERRDLVEFVTASGNIRARRSVDISSDISAKVAELLVEEGEDVAEGQVLLRLDPVREEAGVSRAEAMLSQARATQSQQQANLLQARRNLDRLLALRARDSLLMSRQQLDDAETSVEVAEAQLRSAEFGVSQNQAALDEARDRLSKTIIRAPMNGKITRLNVEEGETVIIGTMNNPGSLVLTISDLSVIEVVVQVDETDVPGCASTPSRLGSSRDWSRRSGIRPSARRPSRPPGSRLPSTSRWSSPSIRRMPPFVRTFPPPPISSRPHGPTCSPCPSSP